MSVKEYIALSLLLSSLAACASDDSKLEVSTNKSTLNALSEQTSSIKKVEEKSTISKKCTQHSEKNLLKNPSFVITDGAHKPSGWHISQHTGNPSFDVSIEDGVLTINKFANQPWFKFYQFVELDNVAGKTLSWSAELKLALEDDKSHGFKVGGGLQLIVWSAIGEHGGRSIMQDLTFENQPRLGKTDWFPVTIPITLGEKSSRIEVGFLHQAGGHFSVRKPSLVMVDNDCLQSTE